MKLTDCKGDIIAILTHVDHSNDSDLSHFILNKMSKAESLSVISQQRQLKPNERLNITNKS